MNEKNDWLFILAGIIFVTVFIASLVVPNFTTDTYKGEVFLSVPEAVKILLTIPHAYVEIVKVDGDNVVLSVDYTGNEKFESLESIHTHKGYDYWGQFTETGVPIVYGLFLGISLLLCIIGVLVRD